MCIIYLLKYLFDKTNKWGRGKNKHKQACIETQNKTILPLPSSKSLVRYNPRYDRFKIELLTDVFELFSLE
jgi:hypothetical protein